MTAKNRLDTFLKPESVAIIGATERPGAWGSIITQSLLTWKYTGNIYLINHRAKKIYGISTLPNINSIQGPVDLAIMIVPEDATEEIIHSCGQKGFKGIMMITAGFGEASEEGKAREKAISKIAHSYGMHIVGPNMSGGCNLNARFNVTGSAINDLTPSTLAGVSQGGMALLELMYLAHERGMGFGKFIHTGNECDLTATDFMEYFGNDPAVKGIAMYLETIRDGKRFIEVARKVAGKKPIVVHKAGRTDAGARAAQSHTDAMAGRRKIFEGALSQANIIICPTMELLLPLGHALMERPPMRGDRVAVISLGGSWGVALSDCLQEEGLKMPTLSPGLQSELRELGIHIRASTKNPVDIGASNAYAFKPETFFEMGRRILLSGEADALVLHGFGKLGFIDENSSQTQKDFIEIEKRFLLGYADLEQETGIPVIIGSGLTPLESQLVREVARQGIRIFNSLEDIARILSRMSRYYQFHKQVTG